VWTRSAALGSAGSWTQTQVGSTGGLTLNGVTVLDVLSAVWLLGGLWMVATGGLVGTYRQPYLWRMTGATADRSVKLGGLAAIAAGQWGTSFDHVAARHGSIECLTPDGNVPRVVRYGTGPRVRARVAA
jgi:hypothetical protein